MLWTYTKTPNSWSIIFSYDIYKRELNLQGPSSCSNENTYVFFSKEKLLPLVIKFTRLEEAKEAPFSETYLPREMIPVQRVCKTTRPNAHRMSIVIRPPWIFHKCFVDFPESASEDSNPRIGHLLRHLLSANYVRKNLS